jgi:enoyl-CoA hydratase/carnithine racemase
MVASSHRRPPGRAGSTGSHPEEAKVTGYDGYSDLRIKDLGDAIALVTLNRPRVLNALSQRLREELIDLLERLDQDDQVRVIVLTGAGDHAFAAGQDLNEARSFEAGSAAGWVDQWARLYDTLLSLGKPVIAAIDGYAVGAGFQLALVCDIRIASTRARFGMPEIDDALPCITGSWSLYEMIGRGRTLDLVISGRLIDAEEALAWGVVTRTVAPERLMEAATELARTLAAKPATAIRLNKRWFRQLLMERLGPAETYARSAHEEAFASGEPQRKMADFLAGRATGRST